MNEPAWAAATRSKKRRRGRRSGGNRGLAPVFAGLVADNRFVSETALVSLAHLAAMAAEPVENTGNGH
ncbi:MAG: hypothetical protein ACRENV_04400 [Candidatus Dormibacteria bacterium]